MNCERACEAPSHHKNCSCIGCNKTEWCGATNVDHFTPKCVAKKMGWKRKQVNKPENRQWLSRSCHRKKDLSTAARKHITNKGFANLDELREWRNSHDLRYVPSSSE